MRDHFWNEGGLGLKKCAVRAVRAGYETKIHANEKKNWHREVPSV